MPKAKAVEIMEAPVLPPERFSFLQSSNLCLLIFNLVAIVLLVNHFVTSPRSVHPTLISVRNQQQVHFVHALSDVLEKRNITYFAGSGTLLSSLCHHGPAPWIHEVTFLIDSAHMGAVKNLLISSSSQYRMARGDWLSSDWTIVDHRSKEVHYRFPFRWPFAKLLFYSRNSSHLWHPRLGEHRLGAVFPLVSRPFGPVWLRGPCNAIRFLGMKDHERCRAHVYQRLCVGARTTGAACDRISREFPTVHRRIVRTSNGTLVAYEDLMSDRTVLRTVRYSIPEC